MLVINELKLSDDKSQLLIDISAGTADSEVIHSVWLEYFANRNSDGTPSSKALDIGGTEDPIYINTISKEQLTLTAPGVTEFERGLFYLIVEVHTPSGREDPDISYETVAIPDYDWMYAVGMNIISDFVANQKKYECRLSRPVSQLILVWHTLRFAMEAKDFDTVDKLWGRFIGLSSTITENPCNCR